MVMGFVGIISLVALGSIMSKRLLIMILLFLLIAFVVLAVSPSAMWEFLKNLVPITCVVL